MTRELEIHTGDVTRDEFVVRCFRINLNQSTPEILLTFDNENATVAKDQWHSLIPQVKTRSLKKWKYSQMDEPMGAPDFQQLLVNVDTTPAYQMLLAGFDIAEAVKLVSSIQDQVSLNRCISLAGLIPSAVGPGRLFFIPDSLLIHAETNNIEALVRSNKLCKLSVKMTDYDPVIRHYIPYAIPIEFLGETSRKSRELWESIRNYYYAFR